MKCVYVLALGALAVTLVSAAQGKWHSSVDAGDLPPPEVNLQPPPIPGRSKRQSCGIPTQMTAAQVTEALNVHNSYRSMEQASNQMQLSWDVNLAAQAQALAAQCVWQHAMLTDCSGNGVGQNLYLIAGTGVVTLNVTSAVTLWYNERKSWNFTSGTCQPGQVCGHWTQVVWAKSTSVGCGYATCPTVYNPSGSNYTNAIILACDYSPAGNYAGQLPYTPGSPGCSTCSSITRSSATNPGYTCTNNLCTPCSPSNNAACQCGPADTCSGNGVWQPSTCSCQCNAGFFGTSCQTACADIQSNYACTYWKSMGYCSSTSIYYAYMKGNCVNTCQLCF